MKVHNNWRSKVLRPVVRKVPVPKAKEFNPPKTKYYSEKICEICDRKFVNGKTLSKHVKSVHLKIKPFICTVCNFKCSRKSVLEIHVRQHKGEKPLACNNCPFTTRDQSSLKQHKRRHQFERNRNYKCFISECDYASIQTSNLKTHIRQKHPERYKDISCDLCSFVTVNSETLAAHKNDHKKGLILTSNEEDKKITSNSLREKALVANEISSDCFLPMESTDSINHEPALDTGGVTIPAHSEDAQF
ncbi:hypothetical protein ACFFRR_010215 [Megaselia abdita]